MNDFGMPGPDEADPVAQHRAEERAELFRLAALSALQHSDNGRRLDRHARTQAMFWASRKPLGRPLSTGEPAHARTHSTEEPA